jgi:hypothetical protein
MCDAPPPEPETDDENENPDGGKDPVDPVTDPTDPDTDKDKDKDKDVVDPDGSLDPNKGRPNKTTDPEVVTIIEEGDDNSSLELVLIILLCVLIPLICILALIVYMFRKNRLNSVQAALMRRNSAARMA